MGRPSKTPSNPEDMKPEGENENAPEEQAEDQAPEEPVKTINASKPKDRVKGPETAETIAPIERKEKPIKSGAYEIKTNVEHDMVRYVKGTFVKLDKEMAELFVANGWAEAAE